MFKMFLCYIVRIVQIVAELKIGMREKPAKVLAQPAILFLS